MPSFLHKLKDTFSHKHKDASAATEDDTKPTLSSTPASPHTDGKAVIVPPATSEYPPAHIDWTKFEPASEKDVRSPCPMLNALCNHHVLPHDGHKITKDMAVKALTSSLNLDEHIASTFAKHAVNMNPDKTAHSFDLDHLNAHGDIEHDVSLSRNDYGFGDNHSYNPDIWANVIATYGKQTMTDFESVSKARYDRVRACKEAHEEAGVDFQYGIKELILSYGESALLLGLLGDPDNGRIPVQYMKILFEEARVPYNEGWRKSAKPLKQTDMNHLMFHLVEANANKNEEAQEVALGTLHAVKTTMSSMMPDYCTVM